MEFAPQKNAHPAIHGVCHMALFTDPDGNDLMLHHRYAD